MESGAQSGHSGEFSNPRYAWPRHKKLFFVAVVLCAVWGVFFTYTAAQRTVSAYQFIAGESADFIGAKPYTDEDAGLVISVPKGWTVGTSKPVWGSTVLMPEGADKATLQEKGVGLVLVGKLGGNMFASATADNRRAAQGLSIDMGEFFLPVEGTRTEISVTPVSSKAGEGWASTYRVVPGTSGRSSRGSTSYTDSGGLVYSAVLGEGTDRWFATYIGQPGDGSPTSPDADWVNALVSKVRKA